MQNHPRLFQSTRDFPGGLFSLLQRPVHKFPIGSYFRSQLNLNLFRIRRRVPHIQYAQCRRELFIHRRFIPRTMAPILGSRTSRHRIIPDLL